MGRLSPEITASNCIYDRLRRLLPAAGFYRREECIFILYVTEGRSTRKNRQNNSQVLEIKRFI
jgi:hypothetical protein